MSMQDINASREHDKFVQTSDLKTAIRVLDTAANSLIPGVYDYIAITYPTTASEVYTFKSGGVGGTTISTLTLTYTDATKTALSSVAKT